MLKEKSIYYHMNLLRLENSIFHGKVWCPKASEEEVA